MIVQITGKLIAKMPMEIIVDVAGIAYEINVSIYTSDSLPKLDEQVSIFTHLIVREDLHSLYGFTQILEKKLFLALIKTNGVGPKLALAILSTLNCQQLLNCVKQQNASGLVKVPGVGPKTAARLLIELHDPLKKLQIEQTVGLAPVQLVKDDAIAALIALGYKPAQAHDRVENCYLPELSSQQLIKAALQTTE